MWKQRPREGRWLAQSHLVTSTGSVTVIYSQAAPKFHPQSRLLSRTSDSDITVLLAQPPKYAPRAPHTLQNPRPPEGPNAEQSPSPPVPAAEASGQDFMPKSSSSRTSGWLPPSPVPSRPFHHPCCRDPGQAHGGLLDLLHAALTPSALRLAGGPSKAPSDCPHSHFGSPP